MPISFFLFGDRSRHSEFDSQKIQRVENDAKHFSNQISWIIWRVMAEIREPIVYIVFLIFSIAYFQLSATVIGINDQYDFRTELEELLGRVRECWCIMRMHS